MTPSLSLRPTVWAKARPDHGGQYRPALAGAAAPATAATRVGLRGVPTGRAHTIPGSLVSGTTPLVTVTVIFI